MYISISCGGAKAAVVAHLQQLIEDKSQVPGVVEAILAHVEAGAAEGATVTVSVTGSIGYSKGAGA
jgi:hypothetical protein